MQKLFQLHSKIYRTTNSPYLSSIDLLFNFENILSSFKNVKSVVEDLFHVGSVRGAFGQLDPWYTTKGSRTSFKGVSQSAQVFFVGSD